MPCCWRACAPPARSTSRVRSPTPATCRPRRGRRDEAEPGRPWSRGLQAPPARRRRLHPARLHPDRRATATTSPSCCPCLTPCPRYAAASQRRADVPDRLLADRGYDHDLYRRRLRACGSTPQVGRRATEQGSGLGRQRWVVERSSITWLHGFRRLLVRYERRADIHEAFLDLACCMICFRRLRASFSTSSKRGPRRRARRRAAGHSGRSTCSGCSRRDSPWRGCRPRRPPGT